jgi:hypothetical protein
LCSNDRESDAGERDRVNRAGEQVERVMAVRVLKRRGRPLRRAAPAGGRLRRVALRINAKEESEDTAHIALQAAKGKAAR